MKKKDNLKKKYRGLEAKFKIRQQKESAIRPDLLLAIPYRHRRQAMEIAIDSEEFSALCPWTGLPDYGRLEIRYSPQKLLLELKSFKYYLLSFRSVGIVQEHAAARIFQDLLKLLSPRRLFLQLDYRVRGGLHTVARLEYPQPDRADGRNQ